MPETHKLSVSDAYSLFVDFIESNLHGKRASNGWYHIRGDSFCHTCASHTRSALYVLAKEGSPPILNCFRAGCGERKQMAASDFTRIGFANEDAVRVILTESTKVARGGIRKSGFANPLMRSVDLSPYQKQILRDRCKFSQSELYDAVSKYRLIPNLVKLVDDNYQDEETRKRFDYLRYVSQKGDVVVFATNDYNTFTIRSEKLKGMISITESVFSGYSLRSDTFEKAETLVVTEGIFDLLNIKRFYGNVDNGVYVATLGFANMYNLIKRYYCANIGTIKNLIIFADSDISNASSFTYDRRMYTKLLNKLDKDLGDSAFEEIYIVYNRASKDFGDFRCDIEPVKVKIK